MTRRAKVAHLSLPFDRSTAALGHWRHASPNFQCIYIYVYIYIYIFPINYFGISVRPTSMSSRPKRCFSCDERSITHVLSDEASYWILCATQGRVRSSLTVVRASVRLHVRYSSERSIFRTNEEDLLMEGTQFPWLSALKKSRPNRKSSL